MIDEELAFVGVKEFYKKRKIIREKYSRLSLDEKWKYKYYIYSHYLIEEYYKDVIWEYLNEPKGSIYYVFNEKLRNCSDKVRI